VLSELLVGGVVAARILGIVGTAVPQLTALVGSVAVVVKGSEEIGKTVRSLLDLILPGRKKKALPPDAESPTKLTEVTAGQPALESEAPSLKGVKRGRMLVLPKLIRASRNAASSFSRENLAKVPVETLDFLVASFHDQQRTQVRLHHFDPKVDGDRDKLQAELLATTKTYEGAVEDLIEELKEAGRSGGKLFIAAVAQHGLDLSLEDRLAIYPVLENLVGRGKRFESLYERGWDQGAFASLEPLVDAMGASENP
jgi:hypothetical protein